MNVFDLIFGPPFDVVAAHAALAGKDVDLQEPTWVSRLATLRSSEGDVLNARDYFFVKADGSSMEQRGIPDGAILVARRVTEDILPRIQKGALVVINGPARYSNSGHRLRIFDGVDLERNVVRFENSSAGAHKPRPIKQLVGVITHTLDD